MRRRPQRAHCSTRATSTCRTIPARFISGAASWQVGLHVIFADKAAHDYYHDHPDHQQFVAEMQPNWAASRVFDTWLE
jgi:hypothetical protein